MTILHQNNEHNSNDTAEPNWSMRTSEDLSTGVKETAKIFKSFIHESQEERSRNIAYG